MDFDSDDGEGDDVAIGVDGEVEQVLSRRWAGGGSAKGASRKLEYLIKWKGLSFLHVGWRTEAMLVRSNPKVKLATRTRSSPPPLSIL